MTFAAINWFILPTFPRIAQHIPYMTLKTSAGASAIVIALLVVFATSGNK